MKSTPPELLNDGSHDAKSQLCQKLLTIDDFPGKLLIGNISETKNATGSKNVFPDLHLKGKRLTYLSSAKFDF